MSEILSRTVFETCLADQSEAPWEEEVRMLLAHDAALRAEVERLRKALKEIADGDHGEYCGLRNQMLVAGGKTECYADCPKRGAAEALATPKGV